MTQTMVVSYSEMKIILLHRVSQRVGWREGWIREIQYLNSLCQNHM